MHKVRAHLSAEQLHHEARNQYWIPKGRITAKRVYDTCCPCKIKNAKGLTPKMADLPSSHLKIGYPAFTHTGLDYFGPIEVSILRRTVKRLGCLFTCLSSRCVHLEMAYSLDTSSFISALDRFQNRRGVPASSHSDNGTNFVGAQRELAECLQNLNQNAILSVVVAFQVAFPSSSRTPFWGRLGTYGSFRQNSVAIRLGGTAAYRRNFNNRSHPH